VIDGVIHDSRTLAPISDVVVFVLDDVTGAPLSPGLFADPTQQGQITAADGRYRIELQPNLVVRLSLERPDARFVFPSVLAPPSGSACRAVRCDGGAIDPSFNPVQGGIYAIRIDTGSGTSARNNHVPIDPLGELLQFELIADRDRAHRGDHVVYTARIRSTAPDPIPDAELAIVLPGALRFLPGSSAVTSVQSGLQLRFPVPLAPGATQEIRFAAKVVELAREPRVVTRAVIERGGGIALSEATAELTLAGDPNLDQSTILGRVFCEGSEGRTGWQDANEPGLYAARIYLDTGFYVESDADGLFSFTGVPPGVRYLKLDEGSLPPKSTPLSPIRRELYLSPGMPGKVSFAIDCRFETWSSPTKIERAAKRKIAAAPPGAPPAVRTMNVAIDADARTTRLADRIDRFLEAELEGVLGERAIVFSLRSLGPITPTRWTIHLKEIDAYGRELRVIRDEALTGPGYPPLFVEHKVDALPPGHAYRARLELLADEDDRALSPPLDLFAAPAAEPVRLLGRVDEASLEEGLTALAPSIALTGDRRVEIEAHWDAAEGADLAKAQAQALGVRAKEKLIALGVPADRIDVVSRGADAPLFPSIVARLRQKNRRVEISLRAPPRIEPPRRPRAPSRAIELVVDRKRAEVPLVDRAQVELTMDVDVPAQLEITFFDGEGGQSYLRRAAAHDWISRAGQRWPIAPAVDRDRRTLDVGPFAIALPGELLELEEVRLVTNGIALALRGRSDVVRWRIEVRDPKSGRLLLAKSETGEPPAMLELAFSSTIASELVVSAEYAERARFVSLPLLLPPWSPEASEVTISGPALRDPKRALAALLEKESESPPAKIALRIDGGSEAERARLAAQLEDLSAIEDPPGRLEGELTLTARLVYDEKVELPLRSDPGEVVLHGLEPVAGELEMEVSGRVLAIEEERGLLLVPLSELALPRAEPPQPDAEEAKEPGKEEAEEAAEEGIDPKTIPAAQVELTLPVAAETLERQSLPVLGRTHPENRIRINGEAIEVDSSGRFAHTLPLEPGRNQVRIESTDPEGNLALFERKVESSSIAWFLMAMGDGSMSTGAGRLAGSNDDTRVEVGPISLDGRIVAYGKARFAFDGPIEQLELTGRFDSAEQGDSTILRLSDDPLRLLPAFGDASLEVQDAASRHKGYLDLTADRSRITFGNSSTKLSPFGEDSFFAFRKAGFGVHADLAQSFGEWDETRIAGTYGFENEGVRRGHDELQGTGGTMYWLSHDELVEGSARVRLVVRDRDTGMVLSTVEEEEGQDFELRPREGRIVFRQPVPHVAGFASPQLNRSVALTGHPIYVVVDYEYLASGADEKNWGVEVRETLFSQVELYFGAAGEERSDGDHRVFAGALAWRPAAGSYVELEYARSTGATGLGAISVDGGLSYRSLDRPLSDAASMRLAELDAPFFNALNREAIGVAGHLDFSDLSEDPGGTRGFVHAYGRKAGLGFSSLSVGREQGRLAGGISAAYWITSEVTARASFDASFGIQPEAIESSPGDSVPGVLRLLGVVGTDYREASNAVGIELAHLRTVLSPDRGSASATGGSIRYERKLTEELSLGLQQEALFGADQLTGGGLGNLATTLFGFWRLTDDLQLSLAESVRWNGDNATQLGMRVETDEGLVAYVAERFSETGSAPRLTTIIGAEDRVAEGSRTYGEVQMDGGAHPDRMRAVIGMDNRWRIADGVDVMLAYERAQLTSGTPAPNVEEPSPFVAPFGGVSATLGGFGQTISFLPGAVSRDAIAAGISWTGSDRIELSQRLELRIDDATAAMGTDYLIIGSHTGIGVQLTRDITTQGRLTIQHARDTTNDRTYARAVEGSAAAIYRQRVEDWFTLVLRYSKLILQRPESLDPDRRVLDRDAFSAEPILDTPWNLQLVERVAFVRSSLEQEGLDPLSGWSLLWVNRLNARFFEVLEAGVEYRMLLDLEVDAAERGFLIEAGYLPVEYVRIGVGYNFTRFSDDVLELADRDASGPFLRVTARY
jgi:hypothetical protein